MPRGRHAVGVMNQTLATTPFMPGDRVTVADIALFAYTHRGDECGLDLSKFPAVASWIERIQALPRFVAMQPPSELTLVN